MVANWKDFVTGFWRVSDWLDRFLPVPDWEAILAMHDKRHQIEWEANKVRRLIRGATSLEHTAAATEMVARFRRKHGETPQVVAAVGSLLLDIYHINENLINNQYEQHGNSSY